ncbi:MAG: hypothetical protein U0903_20420 [Planctomycetales bacterium]
MDWVPVISRWAHIMPVIVLVGGSFFMRFVLQPAMRGLPAEEAGALRERVTRVWKMFVHIGILFLLLSGFYNYLFVMTPAHKGDGKYHMFMGIKILVACLVIFLSIALTSRGAWSEKFRRSSGLWLLLNLLLAFTVVGISGFLKVRGVPEKVTAAVAAPEASSPPAETKK